MINHLREFILVLTWASLTLIIIMEIDHGQNQKVIVFILLDY